MVEILTLRDVAAYLHCSTVTVYRLVSRGQFPGFRVGHLWRFDRAAVDRWIEERGREVAEHE